MREAARQGAADALTKVELRGQDEWLSVEHAATYADLTEPALRALIRRNQVQAHRSAQGHVRIRRSELDVYLEGEAA